MAFALNQGETAPLMADTDCWSVGWDRVWILAYLKKMKKYIVVGT